MAAASACRRCIVAHKNRSCIGSCILCLKMNSSPASPGLTCFAVFLTGISFQPQRPPNGAAAIVNGNRVMKLGPRKRLDFQNVVQEFHQLIGVLANVFHLFRLFEAIEVTADLLYAATRWTNDVIKLFKVVDEQMFRRL